MKLAHAYINFRILLIVVFSCYAFSTFSQKHSNVWNIGGKFSGINSGMVLEFTDGMLLIDTINRDMRFDVTSGSMSDKNGHLQFYTNGCKIFNHLHVLMENGHDLGGGDTYYEALCEEGDDVGLFWPQGAVSLPMENDLYQLFHQNAKQDVISGGPFVDVLYRTVIDMSANNGEGRVISKNEVVLEDKMTDGNLATVQHANGEDWYMVLHQRNVDSFHILHINESGILDYKQQKIGQPTDMEYTTIGQSKFTPDGKKYIYYDIVTGLQIFDFNRGTGVLSNPIHIPFWHPDTGGSLVGGIAVSPNSRFLYVSSRIHLDQFDLEHEDVESSRVYLDSFDRFAMPFPATFFLMQLAPDNKIYMSATNGVNLLHVINQPDSQGLSCYFDQRGIQLPAQNVFSMPYFPNYRLGADSSLLVSNHEVNNRTIDFVLSPNPVDNYLSVDLGQTNSAESLHIHDVSGRHILTLNQDVNSPIFLGHLASGMYLLTIEMEDGRGGNRLFVKR